MVIANRAGVVSWPDFGLMVERLFRWCGPQCRTGVDDPGYSRIEREPLIGATR
jgi:hypothetical protein